MTTKTLTLAMMVLAVGCPPELDVEGLNDPEISFACADEDTSPDAALNLNDLVKTQSWSTRLSDYSLVADKETTDVYEEQGLFSFWPGAANVSVSHPRTGCILTLPVQNIEILPYNERRKHGFEWGIFDSSEVNAGVDRFLDNEATSEHFLNSAIVIEVGYQGMEIDGESATVVVILLDGEIIISEFRLGGEVREFN